jgi:hypothetical protein
VARAVSRPEATGGTLSDCSLQFGTRKMFVKSSVQTAIFARRRSGSQRAASNGPRSSNNRANIVRTGDVGPSSTSLFLGLFKREVEIAPFSRSQIHCCG